MIWKKFTIETSLEAVDILSDFLSEQGIEGIQIEDNVPLTEEEIKQMFVDIPLILGEDDGSAKISCFLDDSFDDKRIEELKVLVTNELKTISQFLQIGSGKISVENTSDDSTWNDKFKENFKPVRLFDDLVIMPDTGFEYDFEILPQDKIINIKSVTAFGTGTHETTKLCLEQVKNNMTQNGSVFDIGCGSGILSIGACLLGAGYVHGLDIDPQAVKASAINAEASGLGSDRIEFSCGNLLADNRIAENYLAKNDNKKRMEKASIGSGIASPVNPDNAAMMVDIKLGEADPIPARRYDIVVANILADVIIPLSLVVPDYLSENGIFVASGISDKKESEVLDALINNGYEILEITRENEWVCIVSRLV
ncbi:MAG: 50S ribosomal protein L11 methyltransferase [Eubacterium sp.]|nr:50S ribosomal protein L11 methyltransferase [Eubacterium sp.]